MPVAAHGQLDTFGLKMGTLPLIVVYQCDFDTLKSTMCFCEPVSLKTLPHEAGRLQFNFSSCCMMYSKTNPRNLTNHFSTRKIPVSEDECQNPAPESSFTMKESVHCYFDSPSKQYVSEKTLSE